MSPSIKENTKGVIYLASTIKRDGFGHKQGYVEAGEKEEPPQYAEKFKKQNKTLTNATSYLSKEFQMPTPKLLLGVGIDGGYCDMSRKNSLVHQETNSSADKFNKSLSS